LGPIWRFWPVKLLKGLGTNLKLFTSKIAWIHWSLDFGPSSEVALNLLIFSVKSCDRKKSMLPNIISLHCLEDIFKNATPVKVGILFLEMALLFFLFSQWYWVSWEKQKEGSNFWLDEAHCTMTSLESLEWGSPLLCLAHTPLL